jgi:hypothetical protein
MCGIARHAAPATFAAPMSLWNTAHPWLRELVSYEPGKPIEDVARNPAHPPDSTDVSDRR